MIQAVIDDELAVLGRLLLAASRLSGCSREAASAALMGWLVFVRVRCVDRLTHQA
ncbi:hypothetical protein [Streptomyces sp. NPDC047108]|uniref:hypothetical protein n=1 Tax=Streptomyces sp. NPDC047108 TaxID=3155025 RepID=UPI00340462AA